MSMTWWPGWNSIEGAAKWGDIFFWAGFACLVLLAGCEILSKVYSWRKDTLLAMRDGLISVAHDVRSKGTEQQRGDARARHDAEIANARAPQVEPDRTAPEAPLQPQFQPPYQPQFQPQFQPQPQPQPQPQSQGQPAPQQAPREAEPLARTPEQVARLQERSPRSAHRSPEEDHRGAAGAVSRPEVLRGLHCGRS